MTDDHAASDTSAERKTLYRVSFVAAGLIAAGVSLWTWEDKHDARVPQPNLIEVGENE